MKIVSINFKNIMFEIGGKSLFIVFNDVDFDNVVEWVYIGIMFN